LKSSLGYALIAFGIIVVVIYMKDDTIFNQIVLIITGVILVLGGLGMLVDTISKLSARPTP
jgi:hypothetical protein